MTRLHGLLIALAALVVVACPARRGRPSGPPPEYERPVLEPWDAGRPVDPLDNVEGEWVTDDPPLDAGVGPDGAGPEAAPLPDGGGVG